MGGYAETTIRVMGIITAPIITAQDLVEFCKGFGFNVWVTQKDTIVVVIIRNTSIRWYQFKRKRRAREMVKAVGIQKPMGMVVYFCSHLRI